MKRNLKIRYYMRGLGLGTAVTALVLGLSSKQGGQMTDEEIKAKAATLGMVETLQTADDNTAGSETTLSQESVESSIIPESSEATPGSESSEEVIESSESSEKVIESSESSEEVIESSESSEEVIESSQSSEEMINSSESSEEIPASSETQESTQQPSGGNDQQGSSDVYTLTVTKGMSSSKVAAALQEAGLVTDAKAYDKYLCRNGYDKSISVGTFQIPYGSSEEEIAKIIAKKK